MKSKQKKQRQKLSLKKETIIALNEKQLSKIIGGDTPPVFNTFTSGPTGLGGATSNCGG